MGALGAATLIPACGDPTAVLAQVTDVDTFSATMALWCDQPQPVTFDVLEADGTLLYRATAYIEAWGHAAVGLFGLRPGTRYLVSVESKDGGGDGPLAFTTLPAVDDPAPLRLLVGADIDPDPAYASAIFDTAADLAPDLIVSLGDWPYADNYRVSTRADYEYAHLQARVAPALRRWRSSAAILAIYDDHEFANDWDGQARAEQPARHEAALAAWDAWFPRTRPGPRYQSWRWGALVELFILDTRAFRSANAAVDGPDKTMLGAEQRAWLIDAVRASTAAFRIIATSVPLDFGNGDDHWAAFAFERDAILDALAAAQVPGVLFVSGDQHWFAAHRHAHGVREFQVGPMARGVLPPPAAAPGVLTRALEFNVGVIDVDATDGPRLRFRALGATGTVLHEESFTPADLTVGA